MVQLARTGSLSAPSRNVVADIVRLDGALVVHRQVRPETCLELPPLHFGVVEGHICF